MITTQDFVNTLLSKKLDRRALEGMELGGIIFPLIMINNYSVYLWGGWR